MQNLNIKIIQSDLVWEDKEKNLEHFDLLLDQNKGKADLTVLPEMFATGFTMNSEKCAETHKGEIFIWMQNKAAETGSIMVGTILVFEDNKLYNRLFWVCPDGSFEYYDKKHLFRFANEHEYFSSGNKLLRTEVKGWRICPLVCYDLRFPVWSRNRYSKGVYEYDCLLYVANWPERRNHHWKSLLVARAIENMSYVVGVNRIGEDGRGFSHSGDSAVIDPMGIVTDSILPHSEKVLLIELSAEILLNWRSKFNVGQDWDDFRIEI